MINKTKKKSLGYDLAFRIARSISLVILFVVAFSLLVIYSLAHSRMDDTGEWALSGYGKTVESKLDYYIDCVDSIAADSRLETGATDERLKRISDAYSSNLGFSSVSFILENGKTYDTGVDYSDSPLFTRAMDGETYISSPMVDKVTGQMVFYVTSRVKNDPSYKCVVLGTVPASSLAQMVDGIVLGEKGYGMILDGSGNIVAHGKNQQNVGLNYITLDENDRSYAKQAKTVQTMLDKQSGEIFLEEDGKSSRAFYTQLAGTDGWTLCVCADFMEMMSNFYNSFILGLLSVVLFTAIAVAFAIIMARPISASFRQIADYLRQTGESKLRIDILPYNGNITEVQDINASLERSLNTISGYISDITQTLNSLASGNYDVEVTGEYVGRFNDIKDSLVSIIDTLNDAVNSIGSVSAYIYDVSIHVSANSQTMAQGATEQASALEELSATINELSENAEEAAQLTVLADRNAQRAHTEITESAQKISDLADAVGEIDATANKVSHIMDTIESLAFKTNILSINAAVEAASAGAAGKNFAVVAGEVQSLADESTKAVLECKIQLNEMLAAVENGLGLSTATAKLLGEVVQYVNETANDISLIATGVADEAVALKQAVVGLEQVSTVIQSNSATSEESAAVSQELSANTQNLERLIAHLHYRKQ